MARDNIEKKLYDWLAEVSDRIGADRVGNMLGGAVVGMARTKATLDKNLDNLLAMANIPSRGDYQKMQAKLDALQGSVVSLSRTVEQLRDTIANGTSRSGHAAKTAAKTASKKSTKTRSRKTTTKRSPVHGPRAGRAR